MKYRKIRVEKSCHNIIIHSQLKRHILFMCNSQYKTVPTSFLDIVSIASLNPSVPAFSLRYQIEIVCKISFNNASSCSLAVEGLKKN